MWKFFRIMKDGIEGFMPLLCKGLSHLFARLYDVSQLDTNKKIHYY